MMIGARARFTVAVTMATSEFGLPLLRRRSAWDRPLSLGPTRRGKWPARPLDPTPAAAGWRRPRGDGEVDTFADAAGFDAPPALFSVVVWDNGARRRAPRARREIGASANDRCSQALPGRHSRIGQYV